MWTLRGWWGNLQGQVDLVTIFTRGGDGERVVLWRRLKNSARHRIHLSSDLWLPSVSLEMNETLSIYDNINLVTTHRRSVVSGHQVPTVRFTVSGPGGQAPPAEAPSPQIPQDPDHSHSPGHTGCPRQFADRYRGKLHSHH